MRKTQPLLSSVNSQDALFAGVCLPAPWPAGLLAEISRAVTPSAIPHARKDIPTEGSLRRYSYHSLTSCSTLRCLYAFKSPQSKVPCGYAV